MNIRLIAMDVDGTLVQDDHLHISARNVETLKKAQQAGYLLAIASGRNYASARSILKQVPFVDYVITCNGTGAWNVTTGESIYHTGMKIDTWYPVYEALMEKDVLTEIYADGHSFMEERFLPLYFNPDWSDEMIAFFRSMITVIPEGVSPRAVLKDKPVDKLCCLANDPENDSIVFDKISALGTVDITSSLAGNWEINAMGMDKAFGLKMLCEHLHITSAEVMAFGDEGNDLRMLEYAGESYCMANGAEAVKKAAKHIAPSNMEDGVAAVIERELL